MVSSERFRLTCGCLINTYPYVPPSISAGWKWGGGVGDQGMREKKREGDKKGRRRVWEKWGTQRVGEKERRKAFSGEGRAGWSLSGDAWCYEDTNTTASKPRLGPGPHFVLSTSLGTHFQWQQHRGLSHLYKNGGVAYTFIV